MFAVTNSIGMFGMNAFPVTVEAEVFKGHPQFDLSGLPDTGIKESRDRVRSAAASLGIQFPKGRVLINLAPADVKKSGSSFDLAIFVCLMQAMDILPLRMPERIFIGELGLHGTVRSVRGVMTMTMLARKNGCQEIYVPEENVREAAVIDGIQVYGISTVEELMLHLVGQQPLKPEPYYEPELRQNSAIQIDFSDVRGQFKARSGMELAAAGGHNILLVGSPGSSKSMLANRLPTILPGMTKEEILETSNVYSVAGLLSPERPLITQRPFRAPHHTISTAGLAGGGSIPAPGEISLAHNGVLFLDELAEFNRKTLEVLRQPLETRKVTISRAAGSAEYPCSFMLVAAMNPCPCGYRGSPLKKCTCTQKQVQNYMSRVSGPMMERFDLHIDVDPIRYEEFAAKEKPESSAVIRERVEAARERQAYRYKGLGFYDNASIPDNLIDKFCQMDSVAESMFGRMYEHYHMSARAGSRIKKTARSSADLHGREKIQCEDVSAAVQFKGFESKYL
ncbi:MAG: YifB family Mg chelatase-like AAA ATPase [Oscillospiraceae bacterium]|nr:YifB family Mg chelatase-like AAA ATPase [Oscillospiraceae bacterium]